MGGKNSHTGPMWAVKQERLFEALEHEKNKINQLLGEFKPQVPDNKQILLEEQLQEINKVFKVWVNLYHTLALLTAANRAPIDTIAVKSNTPGVDNQSDCNPAAGEKCLECGYQLPAFTQGAAEEEGKFQFLEFNQEFQGENIGFVRDFAASFSENNIKNPVISVTDAILQKSAVDDTSLESPPLLKAFLTKTKSFLPNLENFDPMKCLAICHKSVPQIRQQENAACNDNELIKDYVDQALYYIMEIWGGDITSRLTEVKDWLRGFEIEPFEDWLIKKHQISLPSSLTRRDLLSQAINSGNDNAKWVVGGMIAMLNFNETVLRFIYKRCFDFDPMPGPRVSFEEIKNDLTANMNNDEKEQWFNLFAATYAVIAWRILHQVTPSNHLLKVALM